MKTEYSKLKNLFLRQSYLDSWEDYNRSIRNKSFIHWDYVILTASNEDQAAVYREGAVRIWNIVIQYWRNGLKKMNNS